MTGLPFPSGARLCGYLRDSGGQQQELSTDQQEARLVEFCKDNGLLLTRLFRDEARSGGKVIGRRAFLELIDYLESGAPETGVLLWSYSRFSRDYDDTQYFLARLRKAGKVVHSLSDSVPDTLDGRMLESMIAWKNARYREDLSRDVSRGLTFVASTLKVWKGGPVPIGYRLEPVETGNHRNGRPRQNSRLVPDPRTAPQVRQAFEMRARGASLREIIAACPAFSPERNIVSYILRNTIYAGMLVLNGLEIPDYCEPLVDLATWQAAQQVNQARRLAAGPNHPRSVNSRFLLSGLVYCRLCNQRMFGQSVPKRGKRYDYYRCHNAAIQKCKARLVKKPPLEDLVIERLIETVLQPDILADLYADHQRTQSERNQRQVSRLEEVQNELAAIKGRIDRVVAAIAEYGHSHALLAELSTLEESQRQAYRRQAEIEGIIPHVELADPRLVSQQSILILRSDDLAGKREVLRSFIIDIEVERLTDSMQGQLRYRLPLSEFIGFVDL